MSKIENYSHTNKWLDAWHVNPSINRDYDFIDGLRGIAILMVLCCHCIYINPNSGPIIHFVGAFFGAGAGGVVLFYAISGFLISWPFWKQKFSNGKPVVLSRYASRRFWKIYPPLALSLVVLTPVYVLMNHDTSYIPIAAKWLVGIPFLFPVSSKLNAVMWTLVIEVQFYMVLPLVFAIFKKVPPRICLWVIPLIFLLVPAAYRALTGLSAVFGAEINSHFPSALDSFCLGILVAALDNHGALGKRWATLGTVGLLLWPMVLLLLAWTATHPDLQGSKLYASLPWMEKISSACLLCYVANPKHPVAQLLCSSWLRWCGIISYEWYLFHQPIANWARQIFGSAHGNIVFYVAIVGGILAFSGIFSALIYRYFSLPILKYGRASK